MNYNDVKESPKDLLVLVDKYVNVQLIKNTSFEGYVQAIDPISHSIILSTPINNSYQTILIPGHAIMSLTETTPEEDIKPPERKLHIESDTLMNLPDAKRKIMAWFKKNLLPVNESDEKIILGNVTVLPPYRPIDICTDNTVVALQIRRIMENMPDNFDPTTA